MGQGAYGDAIFGSLIASPPKPSQPRPMEWLDNPGVLTEEQRAFYVAAHERWVRRNGAWHPLSSTRPDPETLDFILKTEIKGTFGACTFCFVDEPRDYGPFLLRLLGGLSEGLLDFSFPQGSTSPGSFSELKAFITEKAQERLAQVLEDEGQWTDEATRAMDWVNQTDLWQVWCCYHVVQARLLEEQKENWLGWLNGASSEMAKVAQNALDDIVRSITQGAGAPANP